MRKLFICVFVLTVLDAAATAIGIKMGYLEEANPLTHVFMQVQPFISGLAVCIAAGALLLVLYILQDHIRWIGYVMSMVLIVKSVILGMHISFAVTALNYGYFTNELRLFYSLLFFIGIG